MDEVLGLLKRSEQAVAVDMQLAAVRLDAGAKGLLVEWPEFVGDGVHSVCDGGRPKNSSPAPCSISGSVAAVERAALRRASQHDPPVRRRSDTIMGSALQVKPSIRQEPAIHRHP